MFPGNIIPKERFHPASVKLLEFYPTPNLPSWNKATAIIDETLGRLAKGDIRPKDALADIQSKVQPLVEQDLKAG